MNLRSLVPFGNVGTRANPPANPFGSLQREIDRLFEDFTRGMDVLGQAQVNLVPSMGRPSNANCLGFRSSRRTLVSSAFILSQRATTAKGTMNEFSAAIC